MKISNETKVGAITAIAIVVLILGFNYLKGKNITERNDQIYAIFPSVKGLSVSNAVFINGLQVGKVSAMKETDRNLSGIIVSITLNKNINIPNNSVVSINNELLSSTSLDISLGNSHVFVKEGDTLQSIPTISVMGELSKSINPAINNVNQTLASLDILIKQLSSIIDPGTKNNLQNIISNLTASSRSLERLINAQNGVLARSLGNVEKITGNFAENSDKINTTIDNFEKASEKIANADIDATLNSLKATMNKLQTAVDKISSTDGTLGMLLNDRQLYNEIRQTNRSLTTLLDDVRMNPKRYFSISVFGKKAKGTPLSYPIYDSTGNR